MKPASTKLLIVVLFVTLFLFPQKFVNAEGTRARQIQKKWQILRHFKNPLDSGDADLSLTQDGQERAYLVHVPPTYTPAAPVPLVIAFHGGGGNRFNIRKTSGLSAKADEAGFIVVYPNAVEKIKKWNLGPRADKRSDEASRVDDLGFIRAMLDDLAARYNIDPKRIYATGISNGGAMAYRVACEMGDRIAAIAPVATTMICRSCSAPVPVPVMHFHGTKDKMIPYEGGHSDASVPRWLRVMDDLMPVQDVMGFWVGKDGCAGRPRLTYQKGDAMCLTYDACREGAEVTLCTIKGGGHTWPGGRRESDGKFYADIVGEVSRDISANDLMWDFFTRHTK